jgi:cyclopropane-fatty-acyl-phospholipid synthase
MTSTPDQIEIGYGIANEFFRLWLDQRMHYSCAVFDPEHTTLEQAQRNKCSILADFAEVTADKHVLDIGCGWGANLEYLVRDRMVRRAHGITLARAQYDEIQSRKLPGVWVDCIDYRKFAPSQTYDGLISIEMADHLVSPREQMEGRAVQIYRQYFDTVARWVKPGAHFGFQAILRDRVPRGRKDLEDLKFTADVIFPGGLNPRLEELVSACGHSWEILQVVTRRENYGRTVAEWQRRFLANRTAIMNNGWGCRMMSNGDTVWNNYERYLSTTVRAFDNQWSSDAQMKLRRRP